MRKVNAVAIVLSLFLAACGKQGAPAPREEPTSDFFSHESITPVGLRDAKKIALTFDDGPGKGTEQVLQILHLYKIHATFFCLGTSALAFPQLMRRIREEGHIIANHSYSHQNLAAGRYNDPSRLVRDLLSTHNAIAPYQNPEQGLYFRAPGGAWRPQRADVLNADPILKSYVGPVFWDVGGQLTAQYSADWACWSHGVSEERCLQGYLAETEAKHGGIVLFHDITSASARMVAQYIPMMIAQGYKFVTLDEIDSLNPYRPQTASK